MADAKPKFNPDELTAPLYENGEKPKFDSSLKILIFSVIGLLLLGVLFFIFADDIKHLTERKHHHVTPQNNETSVTPSPVPDSSSKQNNEAEQESQKSESEKIPSEEHKKEENVNKHIEHAKFEEETPSKSENTEHE